MGLLIVTGPQLILCPSSELQAIHGIPSLLSTSITALKPCMPAAGVCKQVAHGMSSILKIIPSAPSQDVLSLLSLHLFTSILTPVSPWGTWVRLTHQSHGESCKVHGSRLSPAACPPSASLQGPHHSLSNSTLSCTQERPEDSSQPTEA